jgi:hypothetical protein
MQVSVFILVYQFPKPNKKGHMHAFNIMKIIGPDDLEIVTGGMNRFSNRRISQKKLFGFRIWRIFYTDLRILLIQRIADLSNILARIVDLACNLVRILDCDFIVEILVDSNLDKTIVGSRILLQICKPLFNTPLSPLIDLGAYTFLIVYFFIHIGRK